MSKQAIDLGIVTNDGEAALRFYRDTLGFRHEGDMAMPTGATMHRLWCGDSLIKIVVPENPQDGKPAPGGIQGGLGYRYWTISVENLSEMVESCRVAGYNVPVPETDIRPGVRIAMVEDPDGNWVEFLSHPMSTT